MDLNYAIILFGDLRIEGFTDGWEFLTNSSTVNLRIEGRWYKTDTKNVLLMHKDKDL